jgi:hypothetical protein
MEADPSPEIVLLGGYYDGRRMRVPGNQYSLALPIPPDFAPFDPEPDMSRLAPSECLYHWTGTTEYDGTRVFCFSGMKPPPPDSALPARKRAERAVIAIASRRGFQLDPETAEQIADAVTGCADDDMYVEQQVTDDIFSDDGAMGRVREHMRTRLAADALKNEVLLTALPHEIVDRPPGWEGQFLRRVRLIAPVRRVG